MPHTECPACGEDRMVSYDPVLHRWWCDVCGTHADDTLVDLFPGSHNMQNTWAQAQQQRRLALQFQGGE